MANFAAKYSIMTQEMVDSFCDNFYIPAEVHPTAPGRDKTITQFPVGKVGVYSRLFDVCGYRIPFTKFFMAVLKYFRVNISQLSHFGAARVSHFEVLTRLLDLSPSVTVFRAFYTRTYSDGLFSFAKRSTSVPSCFPKPPKSIKNWKDHFFWVDSCIFPIFVPLYTGGVLEKDSAPHLTARQEQTVKLLESHKAPFRRYPECFMCLVGLSPYYPFDENSYPAFERSDGTGAEGVISGDIAREYLTLLHASELADPDEGMAVVRQSEEEVVTEQPKKVKKRRLQKQGDALPAKKLRTDHPSLASSTGAYSPSVAPPQEIESFVDLSAQASLQIRTTVGSSSTLSAPVDTAAGHTSQLLGQLRCRWKSFPPPQQVRKAWLELKEKINAKYVARGKLLEEKDLEILRLKSQLAEKEAEATEVVRLRDRVSSLSKEKLLWARIKIQGGLVLPLRPGAKIYVPLSAEM
ncbi:hypothetical protein Tco_0714581 [Tanacetum coccineum]